MYHWYKKINIFKKTHLFAFSSIYFRKQKELRPSLYINAYQTALKWIYFKTFNLRYKTTISNLYIYLIKRKKKKLYKKAFFKFRRLFRVIIFSFIVNYNYFFKKMFIDIYFFKKLKTYKSKKKYFYLIFSFSKNKPFINLLNLKKKKTFLSLSTGLFLKYFQKKKSLKKNKFIKILMVKYLRKLFLLTKIYTLILLLKKNPTFILEILYFLNTPIIHKFIDPVLGKDFYDKKSIFKKINILYLLFLKTYSFTKQKKKKIGRIKRKIQRKLVFKNHLVD